MVLDNTMLWTSRHNLTRAVATLGWLLLGLAVIDAAAAINKFQFKTVAVNINDNNYTRGTVQEKAIIL